MALITALGVILHAVHLMLGGVRQSSEIFEVEP
jgi:hypothetical protein